MGHYREQGSLALALEPSPTVSDEELETGAQLCMGPPGMKATGFGPSSLVKW